MSIKELNNLENIPDLLFENYVFAKRKESVRASRDLLLGIYRDNPRVLGDWGYEVNSGGTSSTKTDNSATK